MNAGILLCGKLLCLVGAALEFFVQQDNSLSFI